MKQMIVMKVYMDCDGCRTKALKIAAVADGVETVAIQGPDKDQLVVVGDGIDLASLADSLRKKVGYTALVSEEAKPPKPGKKKMKSVRKGARTINKKDQLEEERKRKTPPEWVVHINNCLKEGLEYDSGRSCIYRVPSSLKEIHKKSYIPQIISIGPFHTNDPRFKVMEEHKERFLVRLLRGLSSCQEDQQNAAAAQSQVVESEITNDDQTAAETTNVAAGAGCGIRLEDLVGAMRALEWETRECYSEPFDNIDSDDFVRMMVVDGCFVVELLRLYFKSNNEEHKVEDPIFTTRLNLRTLQRDLLMLENQLPFFVLKKLYELTSLSKEPSLIDLTLTFFDPLFPREEEQQKEEQEKEFNHILDVFRSTFISSIEEKIANNNEEEEQKKGFNHILDVCSTFISWIKEKITKKEEEQKKEFNHILNCSTFISSIKEKITKPGRNQLIHCVMELQEAGVRFKKKERVSNNLLDIDFKKGVLEIPPIYIDDNTAPLFQNFVAYEQCDDEAEPFFTNYFMFFDSLINSPMDVEILHKNGIINHALGSDKDVANLFNKLGREIVYDLDQCYLSKQMKEVNEYYESYYATQWHVWRTNLIRDYFSSPWTCLSLFAAIILLLLTFLQTLYTVYSYYH